MKTEIQHQPKDMNTRLIEAKKLYESGEVEAGLALFQECEKESPNDIVIINAIAVIYANRGDTNKALKYFNHSLDIDASQNKIRINLAQLYNGMGYYKKALELIEDYLHEDIDSLQAWNLRAEILLSLGQFLNVLTNLDYIIKNFQSYAKANKQSIKLRYAKLYEKLDMPNTALSLVAELEKDNPDDQTLQLSLSQLYYERGFYKKSKQILDKIIDQNPKNQFLLFTLSYFYFLTGDYLKCWEYYETRWDSVAHKQSHHVWQIRRQLPMKQWQGHETLQGKSIFIHTEQGLGDNIQFLRYLKLLKDRGATVSLAVVPGHEQLLTLFQNQPYIDHVYLLKNRLSKTHYFSGLLSLPKAFKTDIKTVPAPVPLAINADKKAKWQAELGPKKMIRIGFVMRGGQISNRRSTEAKSWQKLFEMDGIEWVLLQIDVNNEEKNILKDYANVKILNDKIKDMEDTAALIELCDKVIAIDSSVAHLAGTMAHNRKLKEGDAFLWLLLPHYPPFRWLLKTDKSPWYPLAKLFRAHRQGNWSKCFDHIAKKLTSMRDQPCE